MTHRRSQAPAREEAQPGGFLTGFRQTHVYNQASPEEQIQLESFLRDLNNVSLDIRLKLLGH